MNTTDFFYQDEKIVIFFFNFCEEGGDILRSIGGEFDNGMYRLK